MTGTLAGTIDTRSFSMEVTPVVEKLYEDANKKYGTDLKYK